MVRKYKFIMSVILVALVVVSLQTVSFAMSNAHTGYLSDVMCAKNGESGGGFNLLTNPEKHTVMCMKMPPCVKSGYGIFMKDGLGRYAFFKLDGKGSALAKGLLDKTQKDDNMSVKVTGKLVGDTFLVESIVEA